MKPTLLFQARAPKLRASANRFRSLCAERLEDRSLLTLVGYQIHIVPPDGLVQGPELTSVSIGESFDVAVTVQDLSPNFNPFPGVFAGYLDIEYDSSKAHVRVAEVQRISISNPSSASGTFSLKFDSETTQPIPFTSNAAALATVVEGALAALPSIGAGNVGATVDVLNNDSTLILQVRFPGKFFDQDVPNLTLGSQNLAGGGNSILSISYEGDLSGGRSDFAFREAFRSRIAPVFPNGLSAGNLPNLIDDVGAFAGLTPTGTGPQELVRARWVATSVGNVTFHPSFANRSLPAHDTLLYNPIAPVPVGEIQPGSSKTLIIQDDFDGPIHANADFAQVMANSLANFMNVLANDSTVPVSEQSKTVIAVTQPAHGTVEFTAEGVKYSPTASFRGVDTFTYTARNTTAGTNSDGSTALVTVTVLAPIEAVADTALTQPGSAGMVIDVLANDLTNPETGQIKNVVSVTQPVHGTVTFTANNVTYAPAAGYSGVDNFAYEARNLTAGSESLTATAVVTVNVGARILAFPDAITIPGNAAPTPIDVLENDVTTPPMGAVKVIVSVTQPEHGSVAIYPEFGPQKNKWATYTPSPGFNGTDIFTYVARNLSAGSSSETSTTMVTVTVTPADSIVARYQVRLVPPDGPLFMPDPLDSHRLVPTPDLAQVNVGESYDLVVTVQNALPGLGVFAGYLDIGYDSSKTQVELAEIQRIQLTGKGLDGTGYFQLSFGGETTRSIHRFFGERNFTNAIQFQLEELPNIGTGNVAVREVDYGLYEVRFIGKFRGENVPNMMVAAENNIKVALTYEGDLQSGFSEFAFKEAFRSRGVQTVTTVPGSDIFYPEGLSGRSLANLIDDVGAFTDCLSDHCPGQRTPDEKAAGFLTAPPRELVRARMKATDGGMVTFSPSLANIVYPDHHTLVLGIDEAIPIERIDLGTSKALTIVPFIASPDNATVSEDFGETVIDVLANDTVPSGQDKRILGVSQPEHGTALLTASGLIYKPAADFVGTDTFTYTAINSAAPNPSTAATATVTVEVEPVNDAPSFIKGADQAVKDETGDVVVLGWAKEILVGPDYETDQSPSFVVTTDSLSLFSVQPAVDAAGRLSFTPALNAEGTAQVTVMLRDNGGTTNGGADTSLPQTFEIHIEKLRPLHNAAIPLDTSGDGAIVAEDALECINYINSLGSIAVDEIPLANTRYLDVDADGFLAPSDPLMIINHINTYGPSPAPGGSEGESTDGAADFSNLLTLLAQDAADRSLRRKRG